MFSTILIANRGEIACRVIRTARRLGIRTVAVFSDADAGALHVQMADEAHRIGAAPASASYLNTDAILRVALAAGAQAIHPGYGFLSENGAFAAACQGAGIVFIGPPAEAILAMGSKSEAKRLMARAGVPLIPGYHGEAQEPGALLERAREIGFPVLIKASAGGGGKGMRVVRQEPEFAEALAGARREALGAFGDDRMLLERYLARPRHVEIQVFADSQGNVVHLFERDCSLQRRYQKVIEEAPAPGLPASLRQRMGAAAVAAARAIGYLGAGTVEFLLDEDGSFYFMEMNTRLQVEHPVTEMITGLDLVEWQLKVAAGEPLPLAQSELSAEGHAFEARIYAEDPARDFLPSAGRLILFRMPAPGPHLRIETGVREGDEIGIHYDPMIAKLVIWDSDRPRALRRLEEALTGCRIAGPATNLCFLASIAAHSAFAAKEIDTGFIGRHRMDLIPSAGPVPDRALALAVLDLLLRRARQREEEASASADRFSPWNLANGWRLNLEEREEVRFLDGETEVVVGISRCAGGFRLALPGGVLDATGELAPSGELLAQLDGRRAKATVIEQGNLITVIEGGCSHLLRRREPSAVPDEGDAGGQRLTAPMPGKVIAVLVQPGEKVERGRPLVILEAMKMEQTVVSPRAGVVGAIRFPAGSQVREGDELLTVEEEG